ncbi:ferric iron reductase [Bdellovibrio svalbardensis]|uniref:Ferric iron reductase n=1 Tax=Bdellovibrio svalbardensis TaxID=2972972 RepID=A0ABT6DGI0_9BACT|nr:ferric iron reductase [Bdellovibrio svalbardensis]MDG0815963.1 ferric iron reductase [Bdellovibrio svalbardensis]
MKKHMSLLLIGSLLFSGQVGAITPAAKALVDFETKSNAIATRSNEAIPMPHFEIPLNLVSLDFADRFPESMRQHLIFQKDGHNYVRWILNPEDTKWFVEVENYFKEKGLTLEKKYYFTGYQTASRSYIVEDPNKEIQFSVKSSTNKTGGFWADKKQPIGEADDSRLNADFLDGIAKKLHFEHLIIMDEPAIMKIGAIDQAVVIRDLNEINNEKSGKIYVPGFSVLHEKTGQEIAAKNGSNDPYQFWSEHYVKAVARALGELAARTGMQFDSPHSQNFLVELDAQYRPTGKIVLRDLADFYIYRDMTEVLHPNATEFLTKFSQKGNVLNKIAAGFGPLHGNNNPSWIPNEKYELWKDVFFKEFERSLFESSGLKPQELMAWQPAINGKYFGNTYVIRKNPALSQDFWGNMRKFQTPRGILNCSHIMMLE